MQTLSSMEKLEIKVPVSFIVKQGPKGEEKTSHVVDLSKMSADDVADLFTSGTRDWLARVFGAQKRKGIEVPVQIDLSTFDLSTGMSELERKVRLAIRRLVDLGVPREDATQIVLAQLEKIEASTTEDEGSEDAN